MTNWLIYPLFSSVNIIRKWVDIEIKKNIRNLGSTSKARRVQAKLHEEFVKIKKQVEKGHSFYVL